MKRVAIVALVCCAAVASARADARPQALPGGMQLAIVDGRLVVERGAVRAPLPLDDHDQLASDFEKVVVDAAGRTVALDVTMCNTTAHAAFTLDALEARLANAAALALHRKKDYAAAATGFARAVALDPSFELAATNQASALALAGRRDDAIVALAPWIAKQPTRVYAKVALDPELAALRRHRAIVALRANKAGTARVAHGVLVGEIAYSPSRGELAVVHREASWGSCNWFAEALVFDAKTGARRAAIPLVEWADSSPECEDKDPHPTATGILPERTRAVAARGKAAQAILRELGFSPAKLVPVVDPDPPRGPVLEQGWTVVDANATVRISQSPGSEGCQGSDPVVVTVTPMP